MAVKRKTINLMVDGNALVPTDAATGEATTDAGVQGENEAVWLHADVPADWQDLTVRLRVTALDGTFDESDAAVGDTVDMPLRQGVLVPGRLAVALVGLEPDGGAGGYLVRKSADCRALTVQESAQPLDPAAQLYPQSFESLKDEVQGECVHTVVGRGAAQVERLDGQTVAVGFIGAGGGDMLAANYANGSGIDSLSPVDHALAADSGRTQATGDSSTALATTAFVKAAIAAAITAARLADHPVGDVIGNRSGINPGTYLGGTWAAYMQGQSPIGVDPNDSDFNAADKTGGEKNHTLTKAELPNYNLPISNGVAGTTSTTVAAGSSFYTVGGNITTATVSSGGGGTAHNNMHPYRTVYFWVRTA